MQPRPQPIDVPGRRQEDNKKTYIHPAEKEEKIYWTYIQLRKKRKYIGPQRRYLHNSKTNGQNSCPDSDDSRNSKSGGGDEDVAVETIKERNCQRTMEQHRKSHLSRDCDLGLRLPKSEKEKETKTPHEHPVPGLSLS